MPPLLIPLALIAGGAALEWITWTAAFELMALAVASYLTRPKPGTRLSPGSTEEYTGTVEPRRIVYGQNLISGLNAIPPWCHGGNDSMLDQVLVLAGHPVAAITDCYANQTLIPSAAIHAISAAATDGQVQSGPFVNRLWIRRHTGAAGENFDWILNNAWPTYWDYNHIGAGLAKLYLTFQYDTTVYSAGKPDIKALTLGKLVYDPRLDTAPGAHPTNASYFAYSNNPALCIVDYVLDTVLGMGEDPSRIDWVSVVAAANVCDEIVAVPLLSALTPAYDATVSYVPGNVVLVSGLVYECILASYNHAPPNGTYWLALPAGQSSQPRYTCNATLDCTAAYEDNLATLAASMQGSVLYSSGKWVLLPGVYQTSSFTIGDDDLAGSVSYTTAIPYASRYNAVRGQFYDPLNLYQPVEYPDIRVLADEIADGEGPVWQELQQPTCINTFEAQRNAIVQQRKSRRKKTWTIQANFGLYGIRPGDFGTLSLTEIGISGQYVKCTGWQLDSSKMTVQLTLTEVNSSDWNDPAVVTYQTAAALATPAPASFVSDPVTSLSATGGAGGITFAWALPSVWHNNLTVELIENTTDSIATGTVIWSGVNTGVFIQKNDTTSRYYWVRIRNIAGNTTSVTTPSDPNDGLAAAAQTAGTGPKGDTGAPGTPGMVASLTLQNIVLPADSSGHVTSYAGAAGKFKLYLGTTDVTADAAFAIAPDGNPAGLDYWLMGETFMGSGTTGQAETSGPTQALVIGNGATAEGESLTGAAWQLVITGTGVTGE